MYCILVLLLEKTQHFRVYLNLIFILSILLMSHFLLYSLSKWQSGNIVHILAVTITVDLKINTCYQYITSLFYGI